MITDDPNEAFEEIYTKWPTQRDRAEARVAFDYIYKKHQHSPQDYVEAVYLWLARASEFQLQHQTLPNWLRDEKFTECLKFIKSSHGLTNAIAHVNQANQDAKLINAEWDRLRRPWWPKAGDRRIAEAEMALFDGYFQENWKKALDMASRIFQYPARNTIGEIAFTPTLEWFCDLGDQTASKIISGYFGWPPVKQKQEEYETLAPEDVGSVLDLIEQTKSSILSTKWSVKSGLMYIELMYDGTSIEKHSRPATRRDLDALVKTLQGRADAFNKSRYEPTKDETAQPVVKTPPPKTYTEEEELFKDLLLD